MREYFYPGGMFQGMQPYRNAHIDIRNAQLIQPVESRF
jgi:hypothetical protein